MQERPNIDLEYQESTDFLQPSPGFVPIVRQIWSLLESIILDEQNGSQGKNHEEFVTCLKDFFRVFSSFTALGIKHAQLSKDFATFLVDIETIFENIQVPNPILTLVSTHYGVSHETIDCLHHLLINKKNPIETRIVILLLFCKPSDLDISKQLCKTFSATYGSDIVVVN